MGCVRTFRKSSPPRIEMPSRLYDVPMIELKNIARDYNTTYEIRDANRQRKDDLVADILDHMRFDPDREELENKTEFKTKVDVPESYAKKKGLLTETRKNITKTTRRRQKVKPPRGPSPAYKGKRKGLPEEVPALGSEDEEEDEEDGEAVPQRRGLTQEQRRELEARRRENVQAYLNRGRRMTGPPPPLPNIVMNETIPSNVATAPPETEEEKRRRENRERIASRKAKEDALLSKQAEEIRREAPANSIPTDDKRLPEGRMKRSLEAIKFLHTIYNSQGMVGRYFGIGQSAISKELKKWEEKYANELRGSALDYKKPHPKYTEEEYNVFKNMAHLIDAQRAGYPRSTPASYAGLSLASRLKADDIYTGQHGRSEEGHDDFRDGVWADATSTIRQVYKDVVSPILSEIKETSPGVDTLKEARELLEKEIKAQSEDLKIPAMKKKKFHSRVKTLFGGNKKPSDFFATCAMKYGTQA